jgi:hypothetical protein
MASDDPKNDKNEQKMDDNASKRTLKFLPASEATLLSDIVRVRGNDHGFYLTFGTVDPEENGVVNYQVQVFLPPKVAGSLATVLLGHVAQYEDKFKTRITPESLQFEVEKKKE